MDVLIGLVEFGSEEFLDLLELRYRVLREPLGLKFSQADIDVEQDQFHLGCSLGGKFVGVLLLKKGSAEVIKMRQVAVDPEVQGMGVGKKLVKFSEGFSCDLGFEYIELHARETAVPFYESMGYDTVGTCFKEVGIPHYKMKKKVGK